MKPPPAAAAPFWRAKPLEAMSDAEWESLCDGCARCCLVKLEDEETGAIHYTDVGCTLLDAGACRCRDYGNRQAQVPDCVRLTPAVCATLPGCRRPAPTGSSPRVAISTGGIRSSPAMRETVHTAGISVRGRVAGAEDEYSIPQLLDHIVQWPRSRRSRRPRGSGEGSGA